MFFFLASRGEPLGEGFRVWDGGFEVYLGGRLFVLVFSSEKGSQPGTQTSWLF